MSYHHQGPLQTGEGVGRSDAVSAVQGPNHPHHPTQQLAAVPPARQRKFAGVQIHQPLSGEEGAGTGVDDNQANSPAR